MRELLTTDHILPMSPGCPVIEDSALPIEDGRNAAIGPRDLVEPRAARATGNRVIMVPDVGAHPNYNYFEW